MRIRMVLTMCALGMLVLICLSCGSPSWKIEVVQFPQEFRTQIDSVQIELLVAGQQTLVRKLALDQSGKENSFYSEISASDLAKLFQREIDSERDSILIRFNKIIDPQLVVYRDSAGQALAIDSSTDLTSEMLQSITCKEIREQFKLDPKVAYSFERRGRILKTETDKLPADPKKRGSRNVVRSLIIDFDPGGSPIDCPAQGRCDYRRPDSTQ